jgi:hypothetical protein
LDRLSLSSMGRSTKSAYRTLAVLKLPRNRVPQLITYATRIADCMTDNPWFPAPVPSLAAVRAAIADLSKAEVTKQLGGAGTATTCNDRRQDLTLLLQQLQGYVQVIADEHPESAAQIIESAGMSVKGRRGPGGRVFSAARGPVSGTIVRFAPSAGDRAAYEFACSLDGGATWILWPVETKASTTIPGLKPGTRVLCRYRVKTKGVRGDWSDPVATIVD